MIAAHDKNVMLLAILIPLLENVVKGFFIKGRVIQYSENCKTSKIEFFAKIVDG